MHLHRTRKTPPRSARWSGWILVWLAAAALSPAALCQEEQESSDPAAVHYLQEATKLMYNPVKEGLKSFRFSRPLSTPAGEVGVEKYWFEAPDQFGMEVEWNKDIPNLEQVKRVMAVDEDRMQIRAEDTLSMYLNLFLARPLADSYIRFVEGAKNTVVLRCKPKPGSLSAKLIDHRDLIFSKEGMIQRIQSVNLQGSVQTFEVFLKELGDTGLMLLDRVVGTLQLPQSTMRTTQVFYHKEIGGFHLVVRSTVELSGAGTKLELESRDIEVNGPSKVSAPEKPQGESGAEGEGKAAPAEEAKEKEGRE